MRPHRLAFLFLLLPPGMLGPASAGQPTRPRASWVEKDAEVLLFAPDGKSLLSSGADGVRLRDAATGRVRFKLADLPHEVSGPAFSPDGQLIFARASSDRYKPVNVFDLKAWVVATGRILATIPYIAEGINASTDDYAISPDGRTLAVLDHTGRLPMQVETSKFVLIIGERVEVEIASNVHPGLPRVRLWDVERWRRPRCSTAARTWSSRRTGATLATGSRDWHVPAAKIWDVATARLRFELPGVTPWVKPMAFSPDGKFLAIGAGDQTLWELSSGKKWPIPAEHPAFQAPFFSPDGTVLFFNGPPRHSTTTTHSACYDISALSPRRMKLGEGWLVLQPFTGKEPALLTSPLDAVRLHRRGRDAGRPSHRRGPRPPRPRRTRAICRDGPDRREILPGRSVARDPDGPPRDDSGRGSSRYFREIRFLDPRTGHPAATIPMPATIWGDPSWKFSPDGRTLAIGHVEGTGSDPDICERPRTIDLWDVPPR